MAVDHIEMALVNRHIDRLADGAAGVMQTRAQVGELDEILEVGQRRVAAPCVEIADKR